MKEVKFANLQFVNWDHIYDLSKNKEISHWWGKTYFYFDKSKNKLYYETFSPIGRLFHRVFGYKKEFNRENLYSCLNEKLINPTQAGTPSNKYFRGVVIRLFQVVNDQFYLGKGADSRGLDAEQRAHFTKMFHEGKIPKDWKFHGEKTPLQMACFNGMTTLAEQMINAGADINARNFATPLQDAISQEDEETVKMLIRKKADVNLCGENINESPLMLAIAHNKGELVRLLIDAGANVNYATRTWSEQEAAFFSKVIYKSGESPLDVAAKYGNLDATLLLLQKGAKPKETTLHKVLFPDAWRWGNPIKDNSNPKIIANKREILRELIKAKAPVNAENSQGETPLHLAIELGEPSFVQILMRHGADKNHRNKQGKSPLDVAKEKDDPKILSMLI